MMMFPKLTLAHISAFILLVSAAALATVLIAQYGFGYAPCILCLWQRPAFIAGIILSALALWRPAYRRLILSLLAVIFLGNAGIAFFHSGVEWEWWAGTSSCSMNLALPVTDIASMREALLQQSIASCGKPSWFFLGLSMANWNIALCFILCIICAWGAKRGQH